MGTEHKSISPLKMTIQIIFSILIITIQLVVYYFLFIGSRKIPYIYIFTGILALILIIHLYNSNDNISYKLTWTIVILLVNVAGPFFYICFGGGNNLPRRKHKKVIGYLNNYIVPNNVLDAIKEEDLLAYRVGKLIQTNTGLYPYCNQGEEFFPDGALMFRSMIEEIDKAQRYIFLEYFIVASGKMLDILMEHLEKKASDGVEIKILYDYVGCNVPMVLKRKDLKRFEALPNCEITTYNPLGVNLNLGINYRDHRKILLIDGECAFVGGINIADEYIHEKARFGYWRDNGMLIRGDACYNYLLIFAQNWFMSTKNTLDLNAYKAMHSFSNMRGYVYPFGDGPSNRLNPAYDVFTHLLRNAKQKIYISTPYFVIDKQFIKILVDQAKMGVEVIILVPEIPDKKIIYLMAENNFEDILAAGGKICKFKGGFNHAKTLVVDDKYAIVGTFNIDYRSMFLHFECCNLLINTPVINQIIDDFMQTVNNSIFLDVSYCKKRNPFKKIIGFLLSILSPLV